MIVRRAPAIALGIVLGVVVGCTPASAQPLAPGFLPANELSLQNYSAEFPPLGPAFSVMRPDLLADYMARQLRDMPDAPETLETVLLMERVDLASTILGRIIREKPEEAALAFALVGRTNAFRTALAFTQAPGTVGPLPALIAEARQQLPRLAPAAASRLEHALIFVEPAMSGAAPALKRAEALRAIIAKYAGTDAALEAEVDVIASTTATRQASIGPLEEFAKQHPGTTAAAKALNEKAFQLSRNVNFRNQDPTDAFLDVFAIVRDLRSGRYPPNSWSARAPWLAMEMFPRNPSFNPGNAERLRAGYIDFVKANFALPAESQIAYGVNSVVINQLFDLFESSGDGITGVESTIADLESIDLVRARDLRGAFYLNRLAKEPAATRPALLQKALDTLTDISRSGTGLYARRALAALASLQYAEGNFSAASTAFATYLDANPDTSWSWVAALRLGQCAQLLGEPDQAVTLFRLAATRYASVKIARQLGHAFAGRVSEAASRFDDAAAEYQQALEGWGDLRGTVRMEYTRPNAAAWTYIEVQGLALKTRLEQLRTSLATAEGTQLERGRWLLTSGDRTGALAALEIFVRAYPKSVLALDARRVLRRAQLEIALEQAGPATASRDEAGALLTLAAIDSQPWDEFAGVARIVAATLTSRRGLREQATTMMAAAVRDWQNNQAITPPTLPTAIADDVAAIRGQILTLESPEAWWRSSGPSRRADVVTVVNPHLTVQLFEATPTRETVYPSSSPRSTIFMTSEAMQLLVDSMNTLAHGSPNPPPGLRTPPEVSAVVSAYLPAEFGMMGGFSSFASVPNVQSVTFTNAERTRATAGIRAVSSGGVLVFEKTGSTWHVVGGGQTYVN